jgi:DNA-binding GntR family transcriptional regulator
MSAIQVAVASNDALKVIDSVQRFHLCILEKTGNPLVLDTGKRLIVPLLAFTRMRVQARNLDASPWCRRCRTIREYLMPLEWEIHIWPNRPSFTLRVSFVFPGNSGEQS